MQRNALLAIILGSVTLVAGCTSGAGETSGDPAAPSHGAPASTASDPLKAQALALYTSKPFNTPTPEHSWLETGDGRLTFLHWDHADPSQAGGLMFVGEGFRAKFCVGEGGVTREEYDAGYVHFHSAQAPNWDAGHNAAHTDGAPSTEGWWLRHVGAVDATMTMMGETMTIQKGKVFPLMAADLADVSACAA